MDNTLTPTIVEDNIISKENETNEEDNIEKLKFMALTYNYFRILNKYDMCPLSVIDDLISRIPKTEVELELEKEQCTCGRYLNVLYPLKKN